MLRAMQRTRANEMHSGSIIRYNRSKLELRIHHFLACKGWTPSFPISFEECMRLSHRSLESKLVIEAYIGSKFDRILDSRERATMRPNQQHGYVRMKYLIFFSMVGILFSGLIFSLVSSLNVSLELLHSSTRFVFKSSSAASQVEALARRPNVRSSVGGFQFPNPYDVSNETLLNYSQFNPAIYTQRDRIKLFLNATDFGKVGFIEFMKRRATGARGTNGRAWMLPFLAPAFDQHMPRFLQLSKRWLGYDGGFHPRILQDLIKKIQKPLEQNAAFWSRKPLTDHDLGLLKGDTRYQSCAVVGNSGILLNGAHGKEIDSHQIVIRLNNAIVSSGYTKHVGNKTDISFMNSNIFQSRSGALPHCWWHRYGKEVPIVLYICQASHLLHIARCASSPGVYTLIVTHSQFDALCGAIAKWYSLTNFMETTGQSLHAWDSAHDEFDFHYSSGMQAVVLALGICDRVDLYGFGKSPNAVHHYHTKQKEELFLHDYAAEYTFYADLVQNRTIPFLSDAGISIPPVQILY